MLDLIKTGLSREMIEEISKQNNEPKWLLERRLENFSVFESLHEPDFVYGLSISLDKSQLSLNEINPICNPEEKILGSAENNGIIVKDLHQALKTHESIIRKYLLTLKPKNKFEALSCAFWSKGVFIYVPKGTEAKNPIEIISKLKTQTNIETFLIISEPWGKLNIIEGQESIVNSKSYNIQNIEIFGKDSSGIEFGCIQNFPENTINFSFRKAVLEKDASIDWTICDLGGLFTSSSATTNLIGPGASVNNTGIFLGKRNQQFDFSMNAIHMAPNTTSDLLTKGALDDRSKGVYGGLVKIAPTATKSSGYQKADIILLSHEAMAAPIPNLEIETNDVNRCAHGASVGQVDKEKLFYMMSRGLSEREAIKQVVQGLLEPAIEKIRIEKVQENLRKLIEERLL